jgi:hypothetical protein
LAAAPPVPETVLSSALPPPLPMRSPTPVPARPFSPAIPGDASESVDLSEHAVVDADSVASMKAGENTLCVNTLRVAIQHGFGDSVPVVVSRLATGDPLPPGTIEAMLVLTGEMEGGKVRSTPPTYDYRAFETWIRRCGIMVRLHGRRALRRLGSRVEGWAKR